MKSKEEILSSYGSVYGFDVDERLVETKYALKAMHEYAQSLAKEVVDELTSTAENIDYKQGLGIKYAIDLIKQKFNL